MKIEKVDKSVLVALSQGDQRAFELIYKLYSRSLYKRLNYILKDEDDAEEVLQNVFIRIWKIKESIDSDKHFYNYLVAISNSLAINHIRRNIRKQAVYAELMKSSTGYTDPLDDVYLKKERWEIVEQAIEQLPPQRKLVFQKCKIEGKSYAEVSKEMEISLSSISNQLVLAMRSVKAFAAEYHKELKTLLFFLFYKN